MKKQTLLLSALALSVGLTFGVASQVNASLPAQIPGQPALPSLAPMLEKVLPAVVSVQVEGTAAAPTQSLKNLKSFLARICPLLKLNHLKGWVPASS